MASILLCLLHCSRFFLFAMLLMILSRTQFQGEEISIGIRGFTFGYDFYAPERSVCFHMYAEGVNKAKRKKVSLFWEHANLYQGYVTTFRLRSNYFEFSHHGMSKREFGSFYLRLMTRLINLTGIKRKQVLISYK